MLMSDLFKPDAYNAVSPYLMAAGAQRVIDFARTVFGATDLRRFDAPDGKVFHAEFRVGDTVIMVADGDPPGGKWPAFPAWLHVYVPDVDQTYRRALAAGAIPVQEPSRKEGDPDRRGGVMDPAGNTWWIATQIG